ncbi:hypothetical protein BS50DRAFT_586389 [Corynespora cassiicola Philippines]|uniref:Uncharacterized protein n=1 Tax=Corynespora cassiicola Philippines TaxID=1448308 RepID=A0A2T2NUB6_CORCC|nr:hypothetical protein BS50DRAFT_586389 [Corynespora cassiicola Philippines]
MLKTTAVFLPLFFNSVFARRGGGGGGGSGGGGAGLDTVFYQPTECYAGFLNPYPAISNETVGGNNETNINKTTGYSYYYIEENYGLRKDVNYLSTLYPHVSWEMEILDAYYNGSMTLTLTPSAPNATYDCPELKSQEITDMFLRIGPQARGNVSRESYGDKNPYYFHFGRTIFKENCPFTPNKAFVNFESSNDNLQSPQIWTLNQKKSGDTFELDGTLTNTLASYNNFWNYLVNVTTFYNGSTAGSDADYPVKTCPTTFSKKALRANTGAKMNATITATSADLTFSFHDEKAPGWTITGSFSGKHWEQGPRVLFDRDTIMTEGETVHVKPRAPKPGTWDKFGKYVAIGAAVFVVLIILFLLWKCCSCLFDCFSCCCACCGRAKQKREERKWREDYDAGIREDVEYKGATHTVTAR